jgi:hypothetical protein
MKEYPTPVPRKYGPHEASRSCTTARNHRHIMEADAGDPIKCTGKSCQSCTAGLIADCVAICCCPCAVVNILAFAFLKVPWTIGKRVLKLRKNKARKNLQRKGKCDRHLDFQVDCGSTDVDGTTSRRNGRVALEQGTLEFVFCDQLEDEELRNNFSARFHEDEEELWFELYQVGHLGFGRVSFTGIPSSLSKGN